MNNSEDEPKKKVIWEKSTDPMHPYCGGCGDGVEGDLRVVEDGALRLQLVAQRQVVHQVAVVLHGELVEPVLGKEWQHVAQLGIATGGGLADVANGGLVVEAIDVCQVPEHVADEPQPRDGFELVKESTQLKTALRISADARLVGGDVPVNYEEPMEKTSQTGRFFENR
ncbi:hypothetical protein TRIUR3_26050 [Triticum urartu]|uniref:Uncharacterized protein n=1 Tax=Triticum urartu TaxID=4572 RepID=M7ZH00_TRIUA|nr:hypothetical protein TRIUR3_26050 [Triticum urartu]